MRDLRANTKPLWYALYREKIPILDDNVDFTGEFESEYTEPVAFRANISPARGDSQSDVFGVNLDYTKQISTTHTELPIDEHTLIWDFPPEKKTDGSIDFDKAPYKVVAVAKGLYHVRYAVKKLQKSEV